MSDWGVWVLILGVGLGTYLLRLSFIAAWQHMSLPPVVNRALVYVPSAVLAALVLPALLRPEGVIDLTVDNYRLLAGVCAGIVAWYSRSVLATLIVGMGLLWGLNYWL